MAPGCATFGCTREAVYREPTDDDVKAVCKLHVDATVDCIQRIPDATDGGATFARQ